MGTNYGSGDGSLFIQPDGVNTKVIFGGCVDIAEIDMPLGDASLWLCRDPAVSGGFKTKRVVRGAPGLVTTSFTTDVQDVANHFEYLKDGTPVYLAVFDDVNGGRKDVLANASRIFVTGWIATNQKYGNLAVARADGEPDRGEYAVDVAGSPPLYRLYDLSDNALRVQTAEDQNVNSVAFSDYLGTDAFAVCDAASGVEAHVLRYHLDKFDDAATVKWAATAADPFDVDEHINGVAVLQINRDVTRVIVGRGSTDVADPAEIAYSDDNGATWSVVDVGSIVGEFVDGSSGIFSLGTTDVWLVTDQGSIYYSADGGLSWAIQASVTAALTDILFSDPMNGMTAGTQGGGVNNLLYTNDGGITWSSLTHPTADDLVSLGYSGAFWWAGDDAGGLWYSPNNGTTWYQREFGTPGVSAIDTIKFGNPYLGVITHGDAIRITYDGGNTWSGLSLPVSVTLNDLWIVGPRTLYAVGDADGTSGVIMKIESALTNFGSTI